MNDLFLCHDNRYVMIEAGPPYLKELKGYLNFFDCGYNKKSIAREVAKWDPAELEEALAKEVLPVSRSFTPRGVAFSSTRYSPERGTGY